MTLRLDASEDIKTAFCNSCYLCNSRGVLLYEGLEDRLYDVPGIWNLRMCSNPECELVWLDPMPFVSDIHKLYNIYFTHATRNNSTVFKTKDSLLITGTRRTFYVLTGALRLRSMRSDLVKMFLPTNTNGRLLEIGCGDGFRLARMRDFGWEVEGQEIDRVAAENASNTYGIKVYVGCLENIRLPSDSYDAVILVHVLEHVPDPYLLLKECHRLLKPGAKLVCVTPNINSYGHNYFHSAWLHLDPPRHLYVFSPNSILGLVKKLAFNNYTVMTTPASAEYSFLASDSILRTKRYRIPKQLELGMVLKQIVFQRRALSSYKQDDMTGEEIVLHLTK